MAGAARDLPLTRPEDLEIVSSFEPAGIGTAREAGAAAKLRQRRVVVFVGPLFEVALGAGQGA
jgi:hypothetical protein